MDAFFASIEERDHPSLHDRPIVVGADPKAGKGRGVVSTCSYAARRYGIHSAMPISLAYQRCPQAVFLPVDIKKYAKASERIFRILHDFTPEVEPLSIDEAFLDITGTYHFHQTPYAAALAIKERIRKEVQLIASIGIAPTKMVAKIASDRCKPDGLLEVKTEDIYGFLWPLPIENLWGVGVKTKNVLNCMGVKTIGDLAHFPAQRLYQKFGESGRHLFDLANGIDPRQVTSQEEIKSVSHEHTFEKDTNNLDAIYGVLLFLSEKVSRRLRKYSLKGKTLTVKIRLKGFKTYTRACTLPYRTNFIDTIYQNAKRLFVEFYPDKEKTTAVSGTYIRLVGIRVSNFEEVYVQESLFEDRRTQKLENIHRAMDAIKDKFGERLIHRAGGV